MNCLIPVALLGLLAQAEGGPSLPGIWLPMLLVGVIYYLVVFRPEKQQRSKQADLLSNLKKNDHVVTVGGIHGTVVNPQPGSNDVVLRIDEGSNTKIHIQRSSISRVITDADKSTAS